MCIYTYFSQQENIIYLDLKRPTASVGCVIWVLYRDGQIGRILYRLIPCDFIVKIKITRTYV